MQLRDARLEEILTPSESDDESNVTPLRKYVIAIWPPYQGPTYLIVPTKQEKVRLLNSVILVFSLALFEESFEVL